MLKYENLMSGLESESPIYEPGTEAGIPDGMIGPLTTLAGAVLITPVLNMILDVKDPNVAVMGSSTSMISNNVIDLTCITSDDLTSSTTKIIVNH